MLRTQQEQNNNYPIISRRSSLKVFYNCKERDNYSSDDFPSKFEDGVVEEITLDKTNLRTSARPLDIVKIFKKRKTRRKSEIYMVHAGIYLGNQKICHAYYDGEGVIRIESNWEGFFNIADKIKGSDEKIVYYRPSINFKKPEMITEHIAKCINGRYFNTEIGFDNFVIGVRKDETANNCECLVNRCVLGLDFSELSDYRKEMPERLFSPLISELDANKNKLDGLVANEQISDEIRGIETLIEIPPNN